MTDDRLERELRSWLADEAARLRLPGSLHEHVATLSTPGGTGRLPERVVTRLEPALHIRSPWPGTRSVTMSKAGKPMVAAGLMVVAIVGVATVVALNLLSPVAPAVVGASPSASWRVTPRPEPDRPVPGRTAVSIDEINFTFEMPGNWEGFDSEFPNYITRSVKGPQGAEGQVMWAGYPATGRSAGECAYLRDLNPAATVAALTEAVASVPGTDVLSRSDASVGGQTATKVVLLVRDDVGCDPGFFFNYPNQYGGALWPETIPGDTVRVWIVDAGGPRLLVIEGKTHPVISSTLEEQIQAIVDSIRFE
jgi:hypothetical protein